MWCSGSQNKNKNKKIKKTRGAGCGPLWSERKMGERAEKWRGERGAPTTVGSPTTVGVSGEEEKI